MSRLRAAALAAALPAAALLACTLALGLGAAPGGGAGAGSDAVAGRDLGAGIGIGAGAVLAAAASPIGSPGARPAAVGSPPAATAARPAAKVPFPKLSAAKIKKLAMDRFAKATSVHVTSTVIYQKQKLTVDLRIGSDAEGTVTARAGSVRLRRVGATIYLQPAAADPAGPWVKITRSDPRYGQIAGLTTIGGWAGIVRPVVVVSRRPGKVFGGTPTIGLYQPGSLGGTLYVAVQGPPYLRYVQASNGSLKVALYDWNVQVPVVQAPADTGPQPVTV